MYSPTLGRWMQLDPAGFVNGANLYEFVSGGPADHVDPLGLDTEKSFKVHDTTKDGSPQDIVGSVDVSISGKDLCSKNTKGKIELKVTYKPTNGVPGKPSDQGYLVINGEKIEPKGAGKELTVEWSTEVGGDGEGHSGEVYVAAVYKPDILDKKDDPDDKGRTGVLHVITINWKYDCACGVALQAEIKMTEDSEHKGQLPIRSPGEKK